jgi:outer membrane protein
LKRLLLILLVGFCSAAASAELKVGFVNTDKILEESPQAKAADERLKKEFTARDQKLIETRKEIRTLEEKLAKDAAVMSEAERLKAERDIISRKRDVKRAQDEFDDDFNLRRNEELIKVRKTVFDAIVALAKQEGFDLILSGGVVFAAGRVDITDKVLERLKSSAAGASTGAASGGAAGSKP